MSGRWAEQLAAFAVWRQHTLRGFGRHFNGVRDGNHNEQSTMKNKNKATKFPVVSIEAAVLHYSAHIVEHPRLG